MIFQPENLKIIFTTLLIHTNTLLKKKTFVLKLEHARCIILYVNPVTDALKLHSCFNESVNKKQSCLAEPKWFGQTKVYIRATYVFKMNNTPSLDM